MNFLPEEILLDIFKNVSARDLICLSFVCKSFYETINKNQKLIKKFQLCFRKLNGDEDSIGSRRYSQLRIGFFKATLHYAILDDVGEHLVKLSLTNCNQKLETIRRILLLTKNVREFTAERVRLTDVPNVLKKSLPVFNDINVTSIESDPRLFRIFNDSSIAELTLCQSLHDGFADFSDLTNVLKVQTRLRSMTMDGFHKTGFFSDDQLNKVKFRLESVAITNSHFNRTVYLKTFLELHANTLKIFKIGSVELCDFSDVLNQSTRLERFSIYDVKLNYLEQLSTVEELTITGEKFDVKILMKLPSVKRLILKDVWSEKVLKIISEYLNELEAVTIYGGSMNGLKLPKVKRMSLISVDSIPNNFFEETCELTSLSMDGVEL